MCRSVARVWALVGLVGVVAGCLSGGPPPTGQRLTNERDGVQLRFLGSQPGAPLLVWRHVDNFETGSELHLLTPSTTDQPVGDRLLAQGLTYDSIYRNVVLDSRGRIVVTLMTTQSNAPGNGYPSSDALVLVDPTTGAEEDLGFIRTYQQSDSGDRIIYSTPEGDVHVHDVDGQDTVVGSSSTHVEETDLAGEDVYYTIGGDYTVPGGDPNAELWRFTSGGTPERLTDHVSQFSVMSGFLVIMRGGTTQAGGTSILDPVTLHETPVPAPDVVSISPDGRWLVATTNYLMSGPQMNMPLSVLFQPATGQTQTLDVSTASFGVVWRPGQDGEAWLSTLDTTFIARPGSALVEISRPILSSYFPPVGSVGPFTSDGKSFLAYQSDVGYLDARAPVYLVPVDDPSAKGLLLNPAGSNYSFAAELSDGGLLVGAWFKDSDRSDFYRYDLANGTSRLLGEAGSVVALGQQRMLVLLHVANQTGDLALVDLDTAATTVLAHSVGAVAVEGPSGSDALAPGTRVAFSLINPIASPNDGIWIVTLP
jgi:hypothetical protein